MFKMAVAATASMQAPALSAKPAQPSARRKDRPNILFIMADQHRGECMGCDGNRAVHTPNMDALAREGVRFRNAYTATPSCIPARAGLLTGLSPWNHGLLGMDGWRIAKQYRHEMAQELSQAGHHKATIGKTR